MAIKAIGFDKIMDKYSKAEKKLVTPQVLDKIGTTAKAMIMQRTSAGKAVSGSRFHAYSPSYKKQRRKAGRTTKVNLQWTGRMLSSIRHKRISKIAVEMSFTRGEERDKATWVSDGGRDFFDLNKRELQKMNARIIRPHIKRLL